MSSPEVPQTPQPQETPQREGMFAAYTASDHHARWPYLLVVLGLFIAVIVAVRTRVVPSYAIETRHGVQRVYNGMPVAEVERMVGHPIGSEIQNGLECRRYGHPTFSEKFWVYSVCYDGGRLVSFKAGQYEAKKLTNIPHFEIAPQQQAASDPAAAH